MAEIEEKLNDELTNKSEMPSSGNSTPLTEAEREQVVREFRQAVRAGAVKADINLPDDEA